MKCLPVLCAVSSVPALVCALPAAVACGAPQGPSGILLGSPLGITANSDPAVRVKLAGFLPGAPPTWPTSLARPDFEHLVDQITPSGQAPVPLLAMSLGLDVIAVAETKLIAADFPDEPEPQPGAASYPVLQLGSHGWYAIEFTVDSRALGSNPDLAPDIAAAKAELDGSVFCYVVPTSTAELLPPERESVRVLAPAALGLAPSDEIRAMSLHMGLYWTDLGKYPNVFTARPLPTNVTAYFTIDADLLAPEQATALKSAWGVEGIDARTIYQARWSGAQWSTPTIDRTATALRIAAPAGVAIDGIALDTKCTDDAKDDELLYSLRGTPTFTVPAAQQLMYVAVSANDPAKKSPRPVVVQRGGPGYGSLGRQVRGGQGIGDFCTADPWVLDDRHLTLFTADPLVDDFLVARRLPPDAPYLVRAAGADGWSLYAWLGQQPPVAPYFGSTFVEDPGAREHQQPVVRLPGVGRRLQPAQMSLAIGGFRILDGERPLMRACMSWPEPLATSGEVTVRWGCIDDYTVPTTHSGNVHWQGSEVLTYGGVPFSYDRPLPPDGVLKPPKSGVAAGVGGSASVPPKPMAATRNAFLMQWKLVADGATYISPIAALRY